MGVITAMRRTTISTLAIFLVLSVMVAKPGPAAAQIISPTRNAVSFSFAAFSGAPVYTLGVVYQLSRPWDLTFAYSFQSVGGVSSNLLGLGARYHLATTAPGVDVFFGGGLGSASATFPGFGTLSASGLFVGAGTSLTPPGGVLTLYLSGNLYSLGRTQSSVIDLGVQARLAPMVSGQLGYISFSGSAAAYLGFVLSLP